MFISPGLASTRWGYGATAPGEADTAAQPNERPSQVRISKHASQIGPSSAKPGPMCLLNIDRSRPTTDQARPNLDGFDGKWVSVGQIWARVDRLRPNAGRNRTAWISSKLCLPHGAGMQGAESKFHIRSRRQKRPLYAGAFILVALPMFGNASDLTWVSLPVRVCPNVGRRQTPADQRRRPPWDSAPSATLSRWRPES